MKKTLLILFVSSFVASFLSAKMTTLPAECHYMYTKDSDTYSKQDLSCFMKFLAVDLNKDTPYDVNDHLELSESIPNGKTIIIKYNLLAPMSKAKEVTLEWEHEIKETLCSEPSILSFLDYGLIFTLKFYKGQKEISKKTISKNSCQ